MKKYKLAIEIKTTSIYEIEIETKKDFDALEEIYSEDMQTVDSLEEIESIVNFNNDKLISIEDINDDHISNLLRVYEKGTELKF